MGLRELFFVLASALVGGFVIVLLATWRRKNRLTSAAPASAALSKESPAGVISEQATITSPKWSYAGPAWVLLGLGALVAIVILFKKINIDLPPITIAVNVIRTQMEHGITTVKYEVKPYPSDEVVTGLVGDYYYIDLKDAQSQRSILFRPEEYVKDEFQEDFQTAMESFRSDVLRHISENGVSFRIFVRGSADISGNTSPYLAELVEGGSKTIEYYPALAGYDSKFIPHPTSEVVPKKYANRHLPNLRAAYIQSSLMAMDLQAVVLQGVVTKKTAAIDRNAKMLLFVKWPAQGKTASTR
jgi:hypothetical protein